MTHTPTLPYIMIQKPTYSSATAPTAIQSALSEVRKAAVTPQIRRKRLQAAELNSFNQSLTSQAPDFATLMAKLYSLTNKMADELTSKPEYTSKDINALTALVKALPTLQAAEKNHVAKLKDKAPEDMSTEDLWAALQVLDGGKLTNSPFESEEMVVAPSLNNEPENES